MRPHQVISHSLLCKSFNVFNYILLSISKRPEFVGVVDVVIRVFTVMRFGVALVSGPRRGGVGVAQR